MTNVERERNVMSQFWDSECIFCETTYQKQYVTIPKFKGRLIILLRENFPIE